MENNPLIIYQSKDGKVKIETHFESEMVWLSIEQIATLFQRDRSVITSFPRGSMGTMERGVINDL